MMDHAPTTREEAGARPPVGFATPRTVRTSLLSLLFFFVGACTTGELPPIAVPAPMAPEAQAPKSPSTVTLIVLPTVVPEPQTAVGTLFRDNGSYARLVTDDPVGPALDRILVSDFKAAGIHAVTAADTSSPATLSLTVTLFRDKIKETLLQSRQTARLAINAVLVVRSGPTTRTLTRTIERHSSPSPRLSFHRRDPSRLLGQLFSDAIGKDLIPFVTHTLQELP